MLTCASATAMTTAMLTPGRFCFTIPPVKEPGANQDELYEQVTQGS